jgi:hypothetical protein
MRRTVCFATKGNGAVPFSRCRNLWRPLARKVGDIAAERVPPLYRTGIVWRRTLHATKRLSRTRSCTSLECRIVSHGFGYNQSRILLPDSEAVTSKQVALCDFVLNVYWHVLLFPIMSFRITQDTKTWLASACFIATLNVSPLFHVRFVLFRTGSLSVSTASLWQQWLCLFGTEFASAWRHCRNPWDSIRGYCRVDTITTSLYSVTVYRRIRSSVVTPAMVLAFLMQRIIGDSWVLVGLFCVGLCACWHANPVYSSPVQPSRVCFTKMVRLQTVSFTRSDSAVWKDV